MHGDLLSPAFVVLGGTGKHPCVTAEYLYKIGNRDSKVDPVGRMVAE